MLPMGNLAARVARTGPPSSDSVVPRARHVENCRQLHLSIVLRALMTDNESVEHEIVPSADRHTLSVMPTEGFAVSYENIPDHHIPAADEPSVPELEADENIPPRPQEEIADVLRAEPDLEDRSGHPEA